MQMPQSVTWEWYEKAAKATADYTSACQRFAEEFPDIARAFGLLTTPAMYTVAATVKIEEISKSKVRVLAQSIMALILLASYCHHYSSPVVSVCALRVLCLFFLCRYLATSHHSESHSESGLVHTIIVIDYSFICRILHLKCYTPHLVSFSSLSREPL